MNKSIIDNSSNLTLITTPRSFIGEYKIIQENAIRSWTLLYPRPKIILIGEEQGAREIAKKYNCIYLPKVKRAKSGVPYLSDIFNQAEKYSQTDLITYINSDIILYQDFINTINQVTRKFSKSLIVGRRIDYDVSKNLSNKEILSIQVDALKNGTLHAPTGIDYFVFKHKMWGIIPPFIVAREYWDRWLIQHTMDLNLPVVNATSTITAIHQNHSYRSIKGGHTGKEFIAEFTHNRNLANNHLASIAFANYISTKIGIIYIPKIFIYLASFMRGIGQVMKDTYIHRIKTGNFTKPWEA